MGLRVLGLALLYFLVARLALRFAFVHASASAVWPPTGIAIAVLLVAGVRLWPGVAIGAFLANLLNESAPWSAVGIAAGNTLEAVVAVLLLERLAEGTRAFDHPRDVVRFVFISLACTVISPVFGVTSLCIFGDASWSAYGPIWMTWWLGDAAGALVVAPPLVMWASSSLPSWQSSRSVEVLLLVLGALATCALAFGGNAWSDGATPPLAFLCIPPLIAASFRFGSRGASTLVLLVAAMAVLGTRQGTGTFALRSANASLLLLQAYLAVLSVMVLLLAAVISERQRFLQSLQEAASHLENQVVRRTQALTTSIGSLQREMASRQRVQAQLVESERKLVRAQTLAHLGSWHWDIEANRFTCSAELLRILGVTGGDVVEAYATFLEYVHPDDRQFFEETLERSRSTNEPFGLEHRIVRADGTTRWLHGLGEVLEDNGKRSMHGTARDITEGKAAEIARRKLEFELLELTYRERSQLGYHLQNDLGQLLTGIAFLSKRVEENLAAQGDPGATALGEIQSLVTLAIEKTRSVARVLVSANIDGQSLQDTLRQLAEKTCRLFAVSCEVHEPTDRMPDVDALTTAHLYRIAQEAISNAVRHGKANVIRIRMWHDSDAPMILAVEDDGVGFDVGSVSSVGLGLPIMHQHAQLLGGTLHIHSTTSGTRVLCRADRLLSLSDAGPELHGLWRSPPGRCT